MSSLRKEKERVTLRSRTKTKAAYLLLATLLARTFLLHFALCSYPSVVFCPKDPSYGLPTSPLPGRRCCRLSTGQTGQPPLRFLLFVALRILASDTIARSTFNTVGHRENLYPNSN